MLSLSMTPAAFAQTQTPGTAPVDSTSLDARVKALSQLVPATVMSSPTGNSRVDRLFSRFTLDDLLKYKGKYADQRADRRARVDRQMQQSIEINDKFIRAFPDSRVLDEILIRQAELLYEKTYNDYIDAQSIYQVAQERYLNELERYNAGGGGTAPTEPVEPTPNYSEVIGLYEVLLKEFPQSEYVDDALYGEAYVYGERLGDQAKAIELFTQLNQRYPESPFVIDSHMLLGEYYFQPPYVGTPEADLRLAAQNYREVIRLASDTSRTGGKISPRYNQALYKLGWSSYRLGDFSDAILRFTLLNEDITYAKLAFRNRLMPDFVVPELMPDAVEYMGVSFVEAGQKSGTKDGVEKAKAFFDALGRRPYYEPLVWDKMGDAYSEGAEHERSAAAYRALLERYPSPQDYPYAPFVAQKVVDQYVLLGQPYEEQQYQARKQLFEGYNPTTAWYRGLAEMVINKEYAKVLNQPIERDTLRAVRDLTKSAQDYNIYFSIQKGDVLSGRTALSAESIASNGRPIGDAQAYYRRAVEDADAYLRVFAAYDSTVGSYLVEDTTSYDIMWNRAFVLDTRLNQPIDAYNAYLEVSRNFISNRWRRDAALNAIFLADSLYILAVQKRDTAYAALAGNTADQANGGRQSGLRIRRFIPFGDMLSLSQAEEMRVNAYDNFSRLYPQDERTPKLLEQAALLYFVRNNFNEAEQYYYRLVKFYPNRPLDPGLLVDLTDGYFYAKLYRRSEQMARSLYTLNTASEAQKQFALDRLGESIYYHGRKYELTGDSLAGATSTLNNPLPEPKADTVTAKPAAKPATGRRSTTRRRTTGRGPAAPAIEADFKDGLIDTIRTAPIDTVRAKAFYLAAAREKVRAFEQVPMWRGAKTSLFEAALDYEKARDYNAANATYARLIQAQPSDRQLLVNAYKNTAANYVALNRPLDAAKAYEGIADSFPDSSALAERSLYEAIAINAKSNNYQESLRLSDKYAQRFPNSQYARDAVASKAVYSQKLGNNEAALQAYSEFVRKYPNDPLSIYYLYKRGDSYERAGQAPQAETEYRAAIARHQAQVKAKGEGNVFYASASAERLSNASMARYRTLEVRPATATADLRAKQAARDALLAQQQAIIAIGGVQAVTAIYNVGVINEEYAQAYLRQDPAARGTTGSKLAVARIDVNDAGAGLYQGAVDQYAKAITLLTKLQTQFQERRSTLSGPDATKKPDVGDGIERQSQAERLDSAVTLAGRYVAQAKEKVSEGYYRIGELKEKNIEELAQTPVPANLNRFAALAYRGNVIDKLIRPRVREAITAHNNTIAQSTKQGLDNAFVNQSRDRLAVLGTRLAEDFAKLAFETNAVFDYYRNEYAGRLNTSKEPGNINETVAAMGLAVDRNLEYGNRAVQEYDAAFTTFEQLNLGGDRVQRLGEQVAKFLYDLGTQDLSKANEVAQQAAGFEQQEKQNDNLYWYGDAAQDFQGAADKYRKAGMDVLGVGDQFRDQHNVNNDYINRIDDALRSAGGSTSPAPSNDQPTAPTRGNTAAPSGRQLAPSEPADTTPAASDSSATDQPTESAPADSTGQNP